MKCCQACGASLDGRRADAKFCSARCRQVGHRAQSSGPLVSLKFKANLVDVSERLVEIGLLPYDACEDRAKVEDALGDFIERQLWQV